MVKRFLIGLVLVVLVCGGLVGFNLFRSKMIGDFFANQQMPSVTISAMETRPTSWTPQIEAIGTLRAAQGVDIATQLEGVVHSIEFTSNDQIEQGQLLVQVDDAVERADVISAEANLARDQAQLERAERLRATGVSSEQTLEEAQTAFAASQSTIARLRAVLDQKAIEAPFAGVIGIPQIDVGEYLQPGTVIATLQQLDTMRVDFTVPEQQMSDLRMEQPAAFGLTEGDFPYEGRIIGIDPKIDPQTRLISVRAEVENPDGELRPGQFIRVRVELPAVADVIALPQTSVVTSLYGDYVYVVEEAEPQAAAPAGEEAEAPVEEEASDAAAQPEADPASGEQQAATPQLVAHQAFVQIGRRHGSMIEITEGLQAGQTVVTSGQNKLANNMPVVINNDIDPAAVALGEGELRR